MPLSHGNPADYVEFLELKSWRGCISESLKMAGMLRRQSDAGPCISTSCRSGTAGVLRTHVLEQIHLGNPNVTRCH